MERVDLLDSLIAKFPDFDPTWDQAARDAWFAAYGRLLSLVEPALCSAPAPVEAVSPPAAALYSKPGPRCTVDTATLAELARAGHSDHEIARQLGVSQPTISRVRREMGIAASYTFHHTGTNGTGEPASADE
jgi:hypothetical protein